LSEILGLRPDDWRQEDGVHYFDIQPHEGRGLKTAASRRRVPIHPEILRLGVSRDVLPFNIKPAVFSQRFARWLRGEVGVVDPRLVFHSIRHTVRDRLRAARVMESEQRALMGWSSQDVADAYGSGFPLSVLLRAVKKIRY
jgi:integrase